MWQNHGSAKGALKRPPIVTRHLLLLSLSFRPLGSTLASRPNDAHGRGGPIDEHERLAREEWWAEADKAWSDDAWIAKRERMDAAAATADPDHWAMADADDPIDHTHRQVAYAVGQW